MTARRGPAVRLGDPRRRLAGGLVCVAALLAVLGGRLVYLQGFEATAFAAQAEKQRLRKVELRAERGQVLDRNNVPLALNVEMRRVYADPKLIVDPAASARTLAPWLRLDPAALERDLRRKGRYVVLARGVDVAVARQILDLEVPGINAEPETRRVYPGGSLAAAVVGFVGREGDGLGGVEYAFDDELTGAPGEMWVETDVKGRPIPSGQRREKEPVAGTSKVLTIERDVQWYAEQVLARQVTATRAKGGSIVVLSVRTGEVLALATAPTFDPNDPAKAPAEARGNPAISNVYEPGSVNKVVTAAAALEENLVTPRGPVLVTPTITVADKTFRDDHPVGTRRMTFTGVIAKSSNVGTIRVAQELGRDRLYDYLRRFGFGERTGVGVPGESAGLLPHPDDWSGSQAGTIPIGQGVSATALQMANVYATVANGGVRVQPTLVRGSVRPDGRYVPAPAPKRVRAISAETAAELSLMLEAVTNEGGTATRAAIPGYRVAGKTGTARKVRADGRGYSGHIASFIGYAPAEAPELVVAVSLDEPVPIYGGIVAAPVFRDVMGFALARLRIPPTGRPAPRAVPHFADDSGH